jgi:hypothetical protein
MIYLVDIYLKDTQQQQQQQQQQPNLLNIEKIESNLWWAS